MPVGSVRIRRTLRSGDIERRRRERRFRGGGGGARNQVAFITIDVRNGERTIVWDRDERLAYLPDEAPVEFGTTGRVLHLDAHDPPACLRGAGRW